MESSYLEKIIADHGEYGAEKLAIAHEFDPFLLADLIAEGERVGWSWDEINRRSLMDRFAAARKYDAALLEEVIREYRPRKASWEEILDCFSCRVIMRGGDVPDVCGWSEEVIPTMGQEN